ncbi:aspartyl aminopeptidase [Acanthamoeba castellanii str. Neff]|uniref:aspartyl aminopeptidase n=1 Tax=Acanthamoeba castellanii (strain ATCC 30010 / Neff) TaxID=1257118 RepID=L8GPK5_ACACF|nr:aspartyl aminopeptidase [Acanthamoeba castellanii str. Neff]ELR14056.1 aspartyl aminopeptidase [Acanthamoeba castellanii str. Neff]
MSFSSSRPSLHSSSRDPTHLRGGRSHHHQEKDLKNIDEQVQGFLDFVNASPSAFHAVQSAKERLLAQGFVQIKETEEWKLKAGEKYFFTRNHSSIFAFVVGGKYEAGNGINISAAHTDSPNLKSCCATMRTCPKAFG